MNKDWIYYGVFFSDNTKRAIYDYVSKFLSENGYSISEDWKKYCDHMTLVFNHGTEDEQRLADFYNMFLNEKQGLRTTAVGVSDRAIALEVDFITANKHSHITVAVAPDAKPVESNDIVEWIPTNGDFYVTGIYKKI